MRLNTIFFLFFFAAVLISQSLMDFASFILLVSLIAHWFRRRTPLAVGIEYFWLLWLVVVAAGFFLNGTEWSAVGKRLGEFSWIFLLYGLKYLFDYFFSQVDKLKNPVSERGIWYAATLTFSICSLFAVLIYILEYDPLRPGKIMDTFPNGTIRTGGFIGQPIVFAHLYGIYLSFFSGILLVQAYRLTKGNWYRSSLMVSLLFAVSLGFLGVLFSFTRGAWIGFVGGLFVMVFFLSKRWLLRGTLIGGVLTVLVVGVWPQFKSRVAYAAQGGDSERVYIWRSNIQMFLDHPLLGVGYGENSKLLPDYYKKIGAPEGLLISHAHNQYLNFLSGTGLVGTGCYLLFLSYFLWQAILNYKFFAISNVSARDGFFVNLLGSISIGTIGAQVHFILGGLTESNFEHAKMKYALVVIWAFILAIRTLRLHLTRLLRSGETIR